jgi:predicted nucleotidyltransferase
VPADPIGGACGRILAAFPGKIAGIYLLGSRAIGQDDEGSDVDLGVVFRGEAEAGLRRAAKDLAAELSRTSAVPVDLDVLDEADAARGIRPRWSAGRLLAGDDVLSGRPLLPLEELEFYFGHLAVYFSWAVRGRPDIIRYPLGYPGDGAYFGYERNGIRAGAGDYRPGCKMLVNVVLCAAQYRLIRGSGVSTTSKHLTAEAYRRSLPGDPWAGLVSSADELCRIRLRGRLPEDEADRRELSEICRRLPDLENDAFGSCLLDLPRLGRVRDPDLRLRLMGIVDQVRTDSAAHAAAIEEARRLL